MRDDHACARCGYNLRGLNRAGRCPECALPVADSLILPTLRQSDPRWLRTIRVGLVLTGSSLAAIVGSSGVTLLVLFVGVALGEMPDTALNVFAVTTATFTVIGSLAGLVGLWLLTMPNPAGRPLHLMRAACRARRLTVAVAVTAGPMAAITWMPLGWCARLISWAWPAWFVLVPLGWALAFHVCRLAGILLAQSGRSTRAPLFEYTLVLLMLGAAAIVIAVAGFALVNVLEVAAAVAAVAAVFAVLCSLATMALLAGLLLQTHAIVRRVLRAG